MPFSTLPIFQRHSVSQVSGPFGTRWQDKWSTDYEEIYYFWSRIRYNIFFAKLITNLKVQDHYFPSKLYSGSRMLFTFHEILYWTLFHDFMINFRIKMCVWIRDFLSFVKKNYLMQFSFQFSAQRSQTEMIYHQILFFIRLKNASISRFLKSTGLKPEVYEAI